MQSLFASIQIFRHRAFAFYWFGRLFATLATLTQSVTLGWQVYAIARLTESIAHSAFLVGMVGLVQFLPLFALTLIAGQISDRHDRRKIIIVSLSLQVLCAIGLVVIAISKQPSLVAIFIVASLFGVARAFTMPASGALGPMLVPHALLPRAIAWNSLSIQAGMVFGPWLGGVLSAASTQTAYTAAAGLYCVAIGMFSLIRAHTKPAPQSATRSTMIREGLAYIWRSKVVFGAISLDLFAVLLGGVTALLPVYARDILAIGPEGFGLLRSGPALGGGVVALVLSVRPIQRHAGPWMLGAVAVYGLATIVFALSQIVALSMAALIVLGAADVISVFVRQSLVQIVTPDAMRGRVSAVSGLFISASNELGEFESGVAARLLGPIGAAIFGGVGAIAVTMIWSKLFPALRRADKIVAPHL